MTATMTTLTDLRNHVVTALGQDGSDEIAAAVADWLRRQPDAPAWGDDWTEWLQGQDFWAIATGLGL